jgi:hypothetical protein
VEEEKRKSLIKSRKYGMNGVCTCILFLAFTLFSGADIKAKGKPGDSLLAVLKNSRSYQERAKAFQKLGNFQFSASLDSALICFDSAYALSLKINDLTLRSTIEADMGWAYFRQGAYNVSDSIYAHALKLLDEDKGASATMDWKNAKANIIGNQGILYTYVGDFAKSTTCLLTALKMNQANGNLKKSASNLVNLGILFEESGDKERSEIYYLKGIELLKQLNDQPRLTQAFSNLANLYAQMAKDNSANSASLTIGASKIDSMFQKGEKAYLEVLARYRKLGEPWGIALQQSNLAAMYIVWLSWPQFKDKPREKPIRDSILQYLTHAIRVEKERGDEAEGARLLISLASYYVMVKNDAKALSLLDEAEKKAKLINSKSVFATLYEFRSIICKRLGQWQQAYTDYKLGTAYRDSIFNEENVRSSIQQEVQYGFQKKAAADSVAFTKEKEIQDSRIYAQNLELTSKKKQQYLLLAVIVLIIAFALFIFSRYKEGQKQKKLIEGQNDALESKNRIIEEKQKEILDSIKYARRIQKAHLPNENFLDKTIKKLKKQ